MQPVISPVDHESRHNSYRADEEVNWQSERTPLLSEIAGYTISNGRNRLNIAIITFLFIILLSGIVISIYLLIVQNNSEHLLPPVELQLRVIS